MNFKGNSNSFSIQWGQKYEIKVLDIWYTKSLQCVQKCEKLIILFMQKKKDCTLYYYKIFFLLLHFYLSKNKHRDRTALKHIYSNKCHIFDIHKVYSVCKNMKKKWYYPCRLWTTPCIITIYFYYYIFTYLKADIVTEQRWTIFFP